MVDKNDNKNPCKELLEEQFSQFGYETDNPCTVCGSTPARFEPRFNYSVCINHFLLSPVSISEKINQK